ncbi:PKD/REJ-like protein [Gracilaria domingensis]|nr:PKD/REJ-like protein [Gracilaria domingensis]
MPPSGSSPEDFVISFGCESSVVLFDDSCTISNTISTIEGTDATAFNTTVACTFERFPATTSCSLSATSVARQLLQFQSDGVPVNVYGIVLYLPDQNGEVSENARLLSGYANSYELETFDREDQGVRELPSYGILPDGTSFRGSNGISLLDLASVSVIADDQIFWYNISTCSITGSSYGSNGVILDNPARCGLSFAARDEDAFPTFGAQFRPFKSGKFTLQLNWGSLGSSEEEYEQAVVFSVVERAPPVVVDVSRRSVYQSLPCGIETLNITGYNFRFSDKREILTSNEDGSVSVWPEAEESFSYDETEDLSFLSFESSGGVGKDVSFAIVVFYGSESLNAVTLENGNPFSTDFSTPPMLLGLAPNVTEPQGDTMILLNGAFDGFRDSSIVRVGGFEILGTDVEILENGSLAFLAPPLSSLGKQFTYEVYVEVCAERSDSLALTYNVAPIVSITAADSSTNDENAYVIPYEGEVTFVAEVSANNVNVTYIWSLFSSDGNVVSLGNSSVNEQIFTVTPDMIRPSGTTYVFQVNVTNSIGISDNSNASVVLANPVEEFILVNVFETETLQRSLNTTTLIQASLVVEVVDISEILLEWTYRGERFIVDESMEFRNGSRSAQDVTGPTKLGLEFNIARRDLEIGVSQLELIATLASNQDISGRDAIDILVVPSELEAIINDGLNGTLILSGNDLHLNGGDSFDPDVLPDESNPTTEIQYDWISCQRSLDSSFMARVSDCSSILPEIRNSVNITIDAADLLDSRLDTTADPDPTFLVFGLMVSKDNRSSETYSYFEMRTVETLEEVPTLSSLDVVDGKGIPTDLKSANLFSDIVIQPESSNAFVSWSFDMSKVSQQYLLLQQGVLREGSGFVSTRGEKSRLPLAFTANALEETTEYVVAVSVFSSQSSLVQTYEVSFVTNEAPSLSCTGPIEDSGITSETMFTISGQLSFETQGVEYCFTLISSVNERFSIGKGCSSVPFASFSVHKDGIYQIECEARTVGGDLVDKVTLNKTLSVSTPIPPEDQTVLGNLAERLANLTEEAAFCEAVRDHGCLTSLISAVSNVAGIVVSTTDSDSSEEAQLLVDQTRSYVANLTRISEDLTRTTVYRPNQILPAIDLTFYLLLVPQSLFDDETTLFAALRQAETAIEITEDSTIEALVSESLVEKVSSIANISLAVAFNIGQEGTSRRRLLQEPGSTRRAFGVLLMKTTRFIASVRAQQESCGFSGTESTAIRNSDISSQVPERSSNTEIPPVELHIQISCNTDQVGGVVELSEIQRKVCPSIVPDVTSKRVVVTIIVIPGESLIATGLLVDVENRATQCPILEIATSSSETAGEIKAGVVRNDSSVPLDFCDVDDCFIFQTDEEDLVSVTDSTITILTKNQGLLVAGIPKERIAGPDVEDIRGNGVADLGSIGVAIGIGIAFVVGTILIMWFAATHFVVAAPAAAIEDDWEYVERDAYGRGYENEDRSPHPEFRAEHFLPTNVKLPYRNR